MIWPSHFMLGYLLSYYILVKWIGLSQHDAIYWAILGGLISILPDLDFIPFFVKHNSLLLQSNDSHKYYFFHAPLFWVIVSIPFLIFPQTRIFGVVFLVATLSHMIGDSIEYGVQWAWPFSHEKYPLHPVPPEHIVSKSFFGFYWEFFWTVYIYSWTFWVEVVLWILFFFLI
jgi:hypothetical protein